MINFMRTSVLISLLGVLLIGGTGCARQKKASRLNTIEAQVNVITEELARLDQSVQEIRGSLETKSSAQQELPAGARLAAPSNGAAASSPVYRTPSGFELPSINIQTALKNAGYYNGRVDGKIGTQTKEAVRAFQRDNDLEADGVVGRRTWDKLKTHLSAAR